MSFEVCRIAAIGAHDRDRSPEDLAKAPRKRQARRRTTGSQLAPAAEIGPRIGGAGSERSVERVRLSGFRGIADGVVQGLRRGLSVVDPSRDFAWLQIESGSRRERRCAKNRIFLGA
ncbi:MAG: hypothetical protein JWO36_1588 [Myxococcales bacterium]|nr:hypothetical protein [Myxococcales bacterium]